MDEFLKKVESAINKTYSQSPKEENENRYDVYKRYRRKCDVINFFYDDIKKISTDIINDINRYNQETSKLTKESEDDQESSQRPFSIGFLERVCLMATDYLTILVLTNFDPKETGKNPNFSLEKIQDLFSNILDIDPLKSSFDGLKNIRDELKLYRNKKLAHDNFDYHAQPRYNYIELLEKLDPLINFLKQFLEEIDKHISVNYEKDIIVKIPEPEDTIDMAWLIESGLFLQKIWDQEKYMELVKEFDEYRKQK